MNQLLSSIKFVADHSDFVQINTAAINQYVADFQPTKMDHWLKACPFEFRPLPKEEEEIERWFLADAMAFCFWGYPTKWTIDYQGKKIDGWWALIASFQRALEKGIPLLDGNYLADLSFAQAQELFAGKPEIPLFGERVEAIHSLGRILCGEYSGRFRNFLSDSPKDATELVLTLAHAFPIFDDVSVYKGEKVYFYKKSQLLVHDLVTGFPDSSLTQITGLEQLTGEADYKIPALLRQFGILVYAEKLADMIDNRVRLPADSPEEIEIRACMLWACHKICIKLKQRGVHINPTVLDGMLWVASQSKSPRDRPYHLTLTTDY